MMDINVFCMYMSMYIHLYIWETADMLLNKHHSLGFSMGKLMKHQILGIQ